MRSDGLRFRIFSRSRSRDISLVSGALENADPTKWQAHRFGLSRERWGSLAGRSYWITGAGTGFGRAISTVLAAAGARVFLTGRRAFRLNETRDDTRGFGAASERCITVPADIRDEDQVRAAASSIASRTGHLHGLVSCAAVPEPGDIRSPLSELTLADWENLVATNVTGQWLVAKHARPLLMRHPGARTIFLSSEAGWADTAGFGPYNVSKSALNSLVMSIAAEWARDFPDRDSQVNILVPGEARTEMNQGSDHSPYAVVSMTLALLTHPPEGPTGRFFHRDGRHLEFGHARPYHRDLFTR
ncbi:MAG: SDR family NAD(P)-dependent oxidoreductase [Betaproteobacteria bacterium]|nr:SDR family NAD(P)-dependent oxidoreductase [Betaproteobacteria bacterium]